VSSALHAIESIPVVGNIVSAGETIYNAGDALLTSDPKERDAALGKLGASALGMIPGVGNIMHGAETALDVASAVTGKDMSVAGMITQGLDYVTGADEEKKQQQKGGGGGGQSLLGKIGSGLSGLFG
jgi:hypothetical protein